jgi:hypothetical protein
MRINFGDGITWLVLLSVTIGSICGVMTFIVQPWADCNVWGFCN